MKIFRLPLILTLFFLYFSSQTFGQFYKTYSSSDIQLGIEKLNIVGSVLYIAAHPDDENTRLLSYLAKEMKVRTGYLSLTRGDGGQNLIGNEQSELLGIIRTQELLAARRIDGAEQFFTRANDFGFSKNPDETFSIWNRDSILADVVWAIRNFRPDIIITRFPTDGSGGHGHHTASALLAEQAMDAAADPTRFTEQLKYVSTWKAKRLLWNGFNFGGRPQSDGKDFFKLDIGKYNTLLGKGYGEIASLSRSQHRSQGFGVPMQRGSSIETFKFIKGDSVKISIFDSIDFSWNRLSDSKNIQKLCNDLIKNYSPQKSYLSINTLILLYDELENLKDGYWKLQKQKEVQELIIACAGLHLEINSDQFALSNNNNAKITLQAINRSDAKIEIKGFQFFNFDTTCTINLNNNVTYNYSKNISVPNGIKYSNPYWLDQAHTIDMYKVSDQRMIGKPENTFTVSGIVKLTINNHMFLIEKGISYKWTDPVKGELYRQTEVLPEVSINALSKNVLFNSKEFKNVSFTIHSNAEKSKGEVAIALPDGWEIEPQKISFELLKVGDEQTITFKVRSTNSIQNKTIVVHPVIEINNKKLSFGLQRIQYDHIPTQTLIQKTEVKLEKVELLTKGKKIGYINGAGDQVANCLRQIGYEVTELSDEQLASYNLSEFDAIVAGIRAYNTNEKLKYYYPRLMKYVNDGGNLIVQYNTNNFLSTVIPEIGPYPFEVSRDRVTDEKAEMRILKKEHPILNYPNKINAEDFDHWVQERGLYFVTKIDSKYETIFSCNDPNEKANEGSLIYCKYGKGTFIYTGIAFFRELPAGVPGAYRLFVNLISQGK